MDATFQKSHTHHNIVDNMMQMLDLEEFQKATDRDSAGYKLGFVGAVFDREKCRIIHHNFRS